MRVALDGGAYVAKSIIANAQRCVNLYPEINQPDAPVKYTHYLTPGLTPLVDSEDNQRTSRCVYRASNGELYEVVGSTVYYTSPTFTRNVIGTIGSGTMPVSMCDNGFVLVIVDGTTSGWKFDLVTRAFSTISDPAFYGANVVQYLDTYFLFNRPNTQQFYVSPPLWDGITPFDPLDIASKSGSPDDLQTLIVMHREIWLIGTNLSTEVWYNSGAADFTFERLPGVFVDHGCAAKYSVARQDVSIYWLSLDAQGRALVLEGTNYAARRISTHAIEAEFETYPDIADAIGFTYQQEGHTFYQLTFPEADKTWVYDVSTGLWHERTWTDENGDEHRHRANCATPAYSQIVVGDWESGELYAYDQEAYTDNGFPIVRRRGFPHLGSDAKRVFYQKFIADIQVGTAPETLTSDPPEISLRWSDTRGASWGNPVRQSVGSAGQYLTLVTWWRMGMARDRVFELFWSFPYKTALNGAFVEAQAAGT